MTENLADDNRIHGMIGKGQKRPKHTKTVAFISMTWVGPIRSFSDLKIWYL